MANDIIEIFKSVFGLGDDSVAGATLNKSREIHAKTWGYVTISFPFLMLTGQAFSAWGCGGINFVFALLLMVVIAIIGTRPEFFLGALTYGAVAGVLKSPQTIQEETDRAFRTAYKFLLTTLFWVPFVFILQGMIPMTWKRAGLFWIALILGLFIQITYERRKIALSGEALTPEQIAVEEQKEVRRTQRFYGTLVFIISIYIAACVGMMIPDAVWFSVIGHHRPSLTASPIEEALSEMARIKATHEERAILDRLAPIQAKLKRGEALTAEEEAEWENILKKNPSFLGKAADTIKATIDESAKAITATTQKIAGSSEPKWKLYKELDLKWGKDEILPPGNYKTDGMFSTSYRTYEPGAGKVISLEERAIVFFKPTDEKHPIVKIWKQE